MPEIKNTFLRGRMNKDLDERLVPNGEYRDASNIQISSTESSDAGTVQNILGNIYANIDTVEKFSGDGTTTIFRLKSIPLPASTSEITILIDNVAQASSTYSYNNVSGNITFTTAPSDDTVIKVEIANPYNLGGTCVGVFPNEETNKIYLFIKGTSVNAIIEYNSVTKKSIPVLVDARDTKILNFTDTKVTGITIIEDYLIWTDNNSEPKIIDITDESIFKAGSLTDGGPDYNNTTKVKHYQKLDNGSVKRRKEDFRESDITLIRKKPNSAPKFIVQTNGTTAATNEASNEQNIIYEDKFVRFAYRWKFSNGQYSAISPFTQTLFLPKKDPDYNYEDGHNKQMINNITNARLVNIEYGSGQPTSYSDSSIVGDVEFIDILYKEANNQNVYLYKTISRQDAKDGYYEGIEVNGESKRSVIPEDQLNRIYDNVPYRAKAVDIVGNRLVFGNYKDGIDLEGFSPAFENVYTETRGKINDEEDKKYKSASAATTSGYASMADTVKDTTTVKSGRKYQFGVAFEDEYGRETPVITHDTGFVDEPFQVGEGAAGYGRNFVIQMKNHPPGFIEFTGDASRRTFSLPDDPVSPIINFPKDINDIKIHVNGVLQTNPTNYTYDIENGYITFASAPANLARIIVDTSRVKRFKYYIKQSNAEYYNVIVTAAYPGDGNTAWLVTPSADFNKVQEGDYIQMKKALNDNDPLPYVGAPDGFKYKVLSIQKDKPESIGPDYKGYFFMSVRMDDNIRNYVINNIGAGGRTNTITVEDTNWRGANKAPDAPRLYLGTYYDEERKEDFDGGSTDGYIVTPTAYYYKQGEIIEVEQDSYDSIASTKSIFDDSNATSSNVSFCSGTLTSSDFGTRFGSSVEWLDITGASLNTGMDAVTEADTLDNSSNKYTDKSGSIEAVAVALAYGMDVPVAFRLCGIAADAKSTANHDAALGPAIFETVPKEDLALEIFYGTSESFSISEYGRSRVYQAGVEVPNQSQRISFYNAFVMGNGVESNRIKDDYLEATMELGIKASTIIDQQIEFTHRKTGLIYSGIYNSSSGVNKLNEFNTGLKITKELNPDYGSIQKIHTRNTDLIVLCEDKVLNVQANKDALYNADGRINLTSTNQVLGQAIAYSGEYGISKNPESFASHGYTLYFADKSRGVILKLSGKQGGGGSGLTVISSKGMTSFFRENLLNETSNIIGSYDIYSDQYILSLSSLPYSISYKENVDGWVSRLTFSPDEGVSINGNYYTCYLGELYQHHSKNVKRNNFYSQQYTSGIKFIFNENPSVVKNFKTIGYEGTEGWLSQLNGVDIIVTDQQKGEVKDYIEKEGKFYSFISGVEDDLETIFGDELDNRLKSFSIQGLGNISNHSGLPAVTATTTQETFTCSDAGYTVADGIVASSVSASASSGTLVSTTPSLYKEGTNTYTGVITVPAGYTNSGENIECIAQSTVTEYDPDDYTLGFASEANDSESDCAFTLATSGNYSSGNVTVIPTFGTNYTDSDTIKLSVTTGTIGIGSAGGTGVKEVNTTKTLLYNSGNGVSIYATNGVRVTGKITSGSCIDQEAFVDLPLESGTTIQIAGSTPDTGICYNTVRLVAETTGTITSYQWYQDTSSGFTPSDSNKIAGATLSYYDARETTADTIYYKVKINGSTNSAEHDIVWTCRTEFADLRFKTGDEAQIAACSASTTLRTIYADTSTFNTATQFYNDPSGTISGFEAGTYSNSSNGTNNYYRFINENGVPGGAVLCNATTGNEYNIITATACRNANKQRNFRVQKSTGTADLAVNEVINFKDASNNTVVIDNEPYWVVKEYYTGDQYEDVILNTEANANSCITQDAPTVDIVGSVQAFTNNEFNLEAQVSHTSQGGTYSYQFTRATSSGGTYSNLGSAQTSNIKTDHKEASAGTFYFKVVLNGSITSSNFLTVVVVDRPTYSGIKLTAGSSIATRLTACKQTNTTNLYGDQTGGIQFSRQLYSAATGANTGSITEGTYSDGTFYAFVNGTGVVQETTVTNDAFGTVTSYWHSCGDLTDNATMSIKYGGCTDGVSTNTAANTNATALLTSCPVNYTPTSYTWTRTPPGGTSATVQTGIDPTYGASESSAGTYTYGVTAAGPDSEGVNVSITDTHQVVFTQLTQTMTVQLCPAGVTRNVTISNAGGYTNGQVISLAAASPVAAGCYKVTNASYSGSVDATTTVAVFQPYSNCCNCVSCSASISMTVGGSASTAGAIQVGSTVVLTASASGYTAASYKWYESVDNGSTYTDTPVGTAATYTPSNSQPGTKVYKCKVTGSLSEEEEATKSISWYSAAASTRYYTLQSYQSDCSDDDGITTGAFESVDPLPNDTVVSLTNSDLCWKVASIGAGDANTPLIDNTFATCTACNTDKNPTFCNFTLTHNDTYPSPTFDMTGGSSILSTDTIRLTVSSGTIGGQTYKDVTRTQLSNGYQVSVDEGVTVTGTLQSGTCSGTTATVVAPLATCTAVQLYKAHSNPAGDATSASLLCGNIGGKRTIYLNKPTLAEATYVSTDPDCSTSAPFNTYLSTGNGQYYVWNGVTLNGPYTVSC